MSEVYNRLKNTIPRVGQGIEIILTREHEKRHATKGNFNLFSILRKTHDEAGLHSRFLHFLLNPKENHDCNRLFLDLFIQMLSRKYPKFEFTDFKKAKCVKTCTEKLTDKGRRIDIYLEFEGNRIIAIEQKIWFHELDMQLSDYADFIKSDNKNRYLFYLTLDGREAETANGKNYLTLSYTDDIMAFIGTCLQSTYMYVNINQALQQYKKVIAELTNQVEENEMNEITELIKKNPSIIIHQEHINQAINKIKSDLYDVFWTKLKKKLEENQVHFKIQEFNKTIFYGENTGTLKLPLALYGHTDKSFLMIGINLQIIDAEKINLLKEIKTRVEESAKFLLQTYYGARDDTWMMGTYHIFNQDFLNDLITNVDSQIETDKKINSRVEKVIEYLSELLKKWDELTK